MSQPRRILLAAHPTVGHTQALCAVGAELMHRGHRVGFAISRVPSAPRFVRVPEPLRAAQHVARRITEGGFEPVRTPFSLRAMWAANRIATTRGYDELGWACELFTCDALRTARTLARHLTRRRIDLVVHDFTFFGAWLAAEAAGVPSAAVFHSGLPFPAPGQPPFGSGLTKRSPRRAWSDAEGRLSTISATVDRRIARARAALGLAPIAPELLTRPYSRALNVLTTFEAFELPRPDLERSAEGPLLWAGPCLGPRALARDDFPWHRLDDQKGDAPLVYLSLGTVFNDQPEVYRALLEGAHRAGSRVVVAAGAALERVRRLARPDDVVVRFAPQLALLDRADLVITHGGNNTTNETLRAGKPLLVLPFGAEQIANARRVEALGVGRMLERHELGASTLAAIIEATLAMRGRAQRLSESVPAIDGAALVADALEDLQHSSSSSAVTPS